MVTNRFAHLVARREFGIESGELSHPGPGEALVRLIANGVCASELHAWEDELPEYPVAMGHEPLGVVEDIGPGVSEVSEGDLVTGRFGPSFASFVVADTNDLVVVPPGIADDDAIAEPLGCVVEGRRRTHVELGDGVAVIGAGYMGLLMIELLAISGAGKIMAIDPRLDARTTALDFGAGEAAHPDDETIRSPAGSVPVVIEASGTQAGLDLATILVAEHGTVSILGFHQGAGRSVDLETWNWKAIDVVNAHVRRRDLLNDAMRRGLELVRRGRLHPGRLVTHRYTLDKIDSAFHALSTKPEGFIKAIVNLG
jgi:threonine dehydrogenase-like Zn-dependent dehydrogenase